MRARETEIAPATLEGWYVLHQLFRLDWTALKRLPEERIAELGLGMSTLLDSSDAGDGTGWSGAFRIVGGGADLMLLHFRPDLDALTEAERKVRHTELGDHLELKDDYLSIVELGLYALTREIAGQLGILESGGGDTPSAEAWTEAVEAALSEQRELAYVGKRLHPRQPEAMPYVCFYPMNKRRGSGQNWYSLSLERRSELMHEHGTVGRRYAGRISQVISGSIGLDDWEWAVTLFAADPLDFKNVVTEMRYDLASAEYADFGEFYVGKRMPGEAWGSLGEW